MDENVDCQISQFGAFFEFVLSYGERKCNFCAKKSPEFFIWAWWEEKLFGGLSGEGEGETGQVIHSIKCRSLKPPLDVKIKNEDRLHLIYHI